jgi:hypothetical protein
MAGRQHGQRLGPGVLSAGANLRKNCSHFAGSCQQGADRLLCFSYTSAWIDLARQLQASSCSAGRSMANERMSALRPPS